MGLFIIVLTVRPFALIQSSNFQLISTLFQQIQLLSPIWKKNENLGICIL